MVFDLKRMLCQSEVGGVAIVNFWHGHHSYFQTIVLIEHVFRMRDSSGSTSIGSVMFWVKHACAVVAGGDCKAHFVRTQKLNIVQVCTCSETHSLAPAL